MADETMRKKTHNRVDKIIDNAEKIRDHRKENIAGLRERVMMINNNVDDCIRRNPKKAVFIATGAGLVAGAVIAASARCKRKNR